MSKIWIKMKHDNAMNMDIPDNINFANAMYGFATLGAEIVPYYNLEDIISNISFDDICIDYIDECHRVFHKFGKTPLLPDYPDVLKPFLGRKIWHDTIDSFSSNEAKWSSGYFVKPMKEKAFTGKIISSIQDLIGTGNVNENYAILVSEPLQILAEWRCFILYDKIMDVRPYGRISDPNYRGYMYHYDTCILQRMLSCFKTWKDRPMACSLDICYTNEGKTLFIEMNDTYSLGCYGLSSVVYAKMISARWSQILNREDEYRF